MTGNQQEQSGQTLAEFAIIIPIFMLVLFGLFDVGHLVYTNASLSQAAREGTRVASTEASWVGIPGSACVSDASAIGPSNPGAHVCPPNVAAFDANVVSAVNRMTVALAPVTAVHLSCNVGNVDDPLPSGEWTDAPDGGGNGCKDDAGNAIGISGALVSVRIEYTHKTFTPFISSLIGTVPLSSSATMVIN